MLKEKRTTLRLDRPDRRPRTDPLQESLMQQHGLSRHESLLVLAAVKPRDRDPLEDFKSLEPGLRELRMRNHMSSLWAGRRVSLSGIGREEYICSRYGRAKGIAEDVNDAEEAYRSLHVRLGLEQPSGKERLRALSEPFELSQFQLMFLGDFQAAQDEGRIPEGDLHAVARLLERLPQDRMAWSWMREGCCVSALAALIHKLRFTEDGLTEKEEVFLSRFFDRNPRSGYAEMLRQEFGVANPFYSPGLFSIIRPLLWNQAGNPLLADMRATHELCVLLDMLGIQHGNTSVRIDHGRGTSTGHLDHKSLSMVNQDSLTSMEICHMGRHMLIDAAFDGVGGYDGGRAASSITRETLEAAALAGWIAGPEDIRRALVLADIIVKLEKADPEFANMCTTAVVSLVIGDEFYGVHCGDSDWKMVRGSLVLSSQQQGDGRIIFAGIGIMPDILVNNSANGYLPMKLEDGDGIFTVTDGVGDVLCDHEYAMLLYSDREEKVLADLRLLAGSRKDYCAEYQPLCGCGPIRGKIDDKSALFRRIRLPKE